MTFSGVKWPPFGLSKGHLEEAGMWSHLSWYPSQHLTFEANNPNSLTSWLLEGNELFGLQNQGGFVLLAIRSICIKNLSHPRSYITKSEIRSQVVAYPHLNMSLQLKSIYTRAELEQRCKNAKRRRHVKKGYFGWSISDIFVLGCFMVIEELERATVSRTCDNVIHCDRL